MQFPEDEMGLLAKTREIVGRVVEKNLAEGLLFSGGIDTSVIAFEASKRNPITAITVGFEHGPAKDLDFAKKMAGFLGIPHRVYVSMLMRWLMLSTES